MTLLHTIRSFFSPSELPVRGETLVSARAMDRCRKAESREEEFERLMSARTREREKIRAFEKLGLCEMARGSKESPKATLRRLWALRISPRRVA